MKHVYIDEDVFLWAMGRWMEVTKDPAYGTSFCKFIGMKTWIHLEHPQHEVLLTPQANAKIQMLLSPHYQTIIKAWLIKNED